jgi:hypothetical protein
MFPKNIKRDFLHGKSDLLSSAKNHMKEGRHTLLNTWGVTMPDRRILHYTWTVMSSHAAKCVGCDDA